MKEYKELVQLEVEEHDVLKLFNQLGPNAKKIVIHILERLAKGAKQYGDFDTPRNWDKESSEEALDLAVYQAAKLLGLGKAEEPRKHVWGSEFRTIGPDGQQVDSNGRTLDGKPWVPPAGARVRVVFQPPHGKRRSCLVIEGRTLTVKHAAKHHDEFPEIGFNEHKNGEPRHCRVVPAGAELEDGPKLQTAREYTAPDGVRVSLDGRTSDGMPWVPPIGTRVRVVARSPKTTINVGDVLTLACSWEFNETWAECRTIAGAAGFVRVVPATDTERDSRWAVSAPRK